MIRTLIALALAAVITFFLLGFMAFLVSGNSQRHDNDFIAPAIEVVMVVEDEAVQVRDRQKPEPPKPQPEMPKMAVMEPESTDIASAMAANMPAPDLGNFNADFSGGFNAGLGDPSSVLAGVGDGEAAPIVRIEPRYPAAAARQGVEGYVILNFTINEQGAVEDAVVVEGNPVRVFDREARRALAKWKYKPKLVDGVPVKQFDQQVRLSFEINRNS
ncbi:energy transducer TonB [Ferrimonas senticii]|uniref:energy transducer TonB n=1 Tax=Ferrimonas senticii TaxID=394566 RepID=UPI000422B3CD|nr:energy transducer TonB [Ferrimonas senticii]